MARPHAAHLVAPLAIATSLGLDHPRVKLSVPFVLGLNGNAVTLSPQLADSIMQERPGLADPIDAGRRFAAIIAARAEAGNKVRMGVVHRYSSHNYVLRYWLAGSGVDVGSSVDIVTVQPTFAADLLGAGEVDGICVGEPWNSVAVGKGAGRIVTVTSHIWWRGVEKVLALPTRRMEQDRTLVHRVIRALYRAGRAFIQPYRLYSNAQILARPEYLDSSALLIERALSDRLKLIAGSKTIHIPDFMFQHREAANFPWISQAAWLYEQMVQAGHALRRYKDYIAAQKVFRPDVYRAAFAGTTVPLPGSSAKLEGSISSNPTPVATVQGRLVLHPDRYISDLLTEFESLPLRHAPPAQVSEQALAR